LCQVFRLGIPSSRSDNVLNLPQLCSQLFEFWGRAYPKWLLQLIFCRVHGALSNWDVQHGQICSYPVRVGWATFGNSLDKMCCIGYCLYVSSIRTSGPGFACMMGDFEQHRTSLKERNSIKTRMDQCRFNSC
jgi:hypothetical protein